MTPSPATSRGQGLEERRSTPARAVFDEDQAGRSAGGRSSEVIATIRPQCWASHRRHDRPGTSGHDRQQVLLQRRQVSARSRSWRTSSGGGRATVGHEDVDAVDVRTCRLDERARRLASTIVGDDARRASPADRSTAASTRSCVRPQIATRARLGGERRRHDPEPNPRRRQRRPARRPAIPMQFHGPDVSEQTGCSSLSRHESRPIERRRVDVVAVGGQAAARGAGGWCRP